MKKFSVSLVLLAVALVFGLAFVSCDSGTPGGDNGTTSGGNSFDTNKLNGQWKNDANSRIIGFVNFDTNQQTVLMTRDDSTYFTMPYNGNVFGSGDHTIKVAFQGEKLRISESKGIFSGYDGLYTKQ